MSEDAASFLSFLNRLKFNRFVFIFRLSWHDVTPLTTYFLWLEIHCELLDVMWASKEVLLKVYDQSLFLKADRGSGEVDGRRAKALERSPAVLLTIYHKIDRYLERYGPIRAGSILPRASINVIKAPLILSTTWRHARHAAAWFLVPRWLCDLSCASVIHTCILSKKYQSKSQAEPFRQPLAKFSESKKVFKSIQFKVKTPLDQI